jgi:hypothetical protein
MNPTRRTTLGLIAGGATTAFLPGSARAATAVREFEVLRAGRDIGRHRIAVTREGADVSVTVDVDLVVRVLGIAAYRYTMRNRETWRDGVLITGDSDVNDDGRRKRVVSRREGGVLMVESPDFTGQAPDPLATTTYFTQAFLDRPTWLSTDSGDLFGVTPRRAGEATVDTAAGPVACTRWAVTDGGAFTVDLFYDSRGEWLSVGFDAGGERAIYRPLDTGPQLAPLWAAA